MCGISVVIKTRDIELSVSVLENMRDSVSHRGPDDMGLTLFNYSGNQIKKNDDNQDPWVISLAHRRLSIIDISKKGHQPMVYNGKYWITYNGEVYNYLEIKKELIKLGHKFCSRTDTEVVLAAYAEWGNACFKRFRGMWGLVILDLEKNKVICSRDRMGIKPLYIWESNGLIAIVSEIKQLTQLKNFNPRLNEPIAFEYLYTGYQSDKDSFFKDVHPVIPGTWSVIDPINNSIDESKEYWFPEGIKQNITSPKRAGKLFIKKFEESIKLHLRSDVKVGCALSGGLDSSSIACLVSNNNENRTLETFTVSFPGEEIDELEYCQDILSNIKANPNIITPTAENFISDFNDFVYTHDEPVGGLSVYASYKLAQLINQTGVPVTLNGQGGDELLSGYWQLYFLFLYNKLSELKINQVMSHIFGAALPTGNNELLKNIPNMIIRYYQRKNPKNVIRLNENYQNNNKDIFNEVISGGIEQNRIQQLRSLFLPKYLRYDDRNTMAFSVEGRYPLLDHELIELCLSFKSSTLFKDGWNKHPMRLGLKGILPNKILNRKTKFGFEIPWRSWFIGPLKNEIENWLNIDRPVWEYVEKKSIVNLVDDTFRSKSSNKLHFHNIFRVYNFDRWLEIFNVGS